MESITPRVMTLTRLTETKFDVTVPDSCPHCKKPVGELRTHEMAVGTVYYDADGNPNDGDMPEYGDTVLAIICSECGALGCWGAVPVMRPRERTVSTIDVTERVFPASWRAAFLKVLSRRMGAANAAEALSTPCGEPESCPGFGHDGLRVVTCDACFAQWHSTLKPRRDAIRFVTDDDAAAAADLALLEVLQTLPEPQRQQLMYLTGVVLE